jgi:hypothetical protein
MKTVILVWKNNYNPIKYCCDDLFTCIKASCFLYNLSYVMNFKLYIDFQHHSISKCLPDINHPYKQFISENKNNIPIVHDVEDYISSSDSNFLFFYTSTYLCINPNNNCKQFISKILHPPNFMIQAINSISVHTILHLKLNNSIITSFKYPYLLYTVYERIKQYLSPGIIILSDTHEIKKYIKTKYPECVVFDTLIGNIGFEPHNDAVCDTMFDLYLMTKAKKIFSFSWYSSIPGFLRITAIYDIPIHEIKIDK